MREKVNRFNYMGWGGETHAEGYNTELYLYTKIEGVYREFKVEFDVSSMETLRDELNRCIKRSRVLGRKEDKKKKNV